MTPRKAFIKILILFLPLSFLHSQWYSNAWPHRFIPLEGLAGKIDYAQFLHDGSEVTTAAGEWYVNQGLCSKDDAVITLPHMPPKITVPVIELFLK